jgi:purine-binding chemotaxis protein CheW
VGEASVICVEVAGSAYGLAVADVQEVIGYRTPTRLFHAPAALAGITSLRGEVLPIIDLASLLEGEGAATRPVAIEPRVVVVREAAGARRRAGFKVDALLGLRDMAPSAVREVPPAVSARLGGLVVGVVSEPPPAFALLSVAGIFDAPALQKLAGGAIE